MELRLSKERGSAYYWAMFPDRNKLSDLDRPSVWLSKNAKVVRYLAVIVSNVLLTIAVSIALELLGFFPTTIILGTALCAYLLEPAAGIVAGMILCAAGACVYNEPFEALYIFEYVLVSLTFGLVVEVEGPETEQERIAAIDTLKRELHDLANWQSETEEKIRATNKKLAELLSAEKGTEEALGSAINENPNG